MPSIEGEPLLGLCMGERPYVALEPGDIRAARCGEIACPRVAAHIAIRS